MRIIVGCVDAPAVRFENEESLEAVGVEILAFADAPSARVRIAEADVPLTDLVMPHMDGLAFLAAACTDEPDLPIIMLTARGSERTAVQAFKQGAYDYPAKPFAVDDLRLAVSRALEARSLRLTAAELADGRALGTPLIGEHPAFRRVV